MPEPLEDRTTELAEVYFETFDSDDPYDQPTSPGQVLGLDDEEVLRAARNSRNGDKFENLWNADFDNYKSQSEADLALCSILYFHCGDRSQVDGLFRQSGLMREKWDRDDYRKSTLDRACINMPDRDQRPSNVADATTTEAFAPVLLELEDEPDPPEFVVDRLIVRDRVNTFYGDSGQGKSTFVGLLALCVASGFPFLDIPVIKGPVLILDWELDLQITLWRMFKLVRGLGWEKIPGDIRYKSLYASLKDEFSGINHWIEENKPILVIIDSFGPASGGDPMDQKLAVELMGLVRQLNTTILLVDHQANPQAGKFYSQQRAFGSSWKTHLTRSAIQVEKISSIPGRLSVVLRHQKTNFGPLMENLPIRILFGDRDIRIVRAPESAEEFKSAGQLSIPKRLENFLKTNKGEEFTVKELVEEIKGKDESIRNALGKLRGRGLITSQKPMDDRELKWQWAG